MALNGYQSERAECIRQARSILGDSAEVTDLVAVASWILNGEDPWPSAVTLPDMARVGE